MTLTCHVTEEEHNEIYARMRKLGEKKISSFARSMLLAGRYNELDYSELKMQSFFLQRISKNIEKILLNVEKNGIAREREIEEIRLALADIWRLEKMNLTKYRVLN